VDPASGLASAYVNSNSDGDDGAPLTDYDLIGSTEQQTGLFALHGVNFNFLCLPPLSRDQDVGPSALLVAARFCRQRRALLIVDPPLGWHTADDALSGLRGLEFANENAVMYFPRVLAHDKLRGHFESFAPCGAVAGMLARQDEIHPVWAPAADEEPVLRPGYRAACLVGEDKRLRLAALGVNSLQSVRGVARAGVRARTLAAGSAAHADWKFLGARRLALFILNSIEHGTRWAADLNAYEGVAAAVATQVREFFESLHAAGAFGTLPAEDAFFVICDTRANPAPPKSGEFHLIIGFAAGREREFHTFRITHCATGARVQSVRLNGLQVSPYSPAELKWVDRIASQLEG
jgi:phage tail sheath protein FI